MKIRLIGLGRMGLNMALNMKEHGHDVLGFAKTQETRQKAKMQGINVANSCKEMFENREEKIVVWILVPHTQAECVIEEVVPHLKKGDILIDAGNSNFNLSIKRYEKYKQMGISFVDMGTSGGVKGARHGACLMVGGDKESFEYIEPVVKDVCAEGGYAYTGKPGSGHFVKMVHNSVEYGIMQAMGEGFDLMQKTNFDFDYEKITSAWNNGSMLESELMRNVNNAFKKDSKLEQIEGRVDDSGEGRWMVEEAIKQKVSMPAITSALFARYKSKDNLMFSEKVVAAIRKEFGGHTVYKK